jgi:hypothetical protein
MRPLKDRHLFRVSAKTFLLNARHIISPLRNHSGLGAFLPPEGTGVLEYAAAR